MSQPAPDPSAPMVWITRAQAGALATAEGVRALGLFPLVAPLLRVLPIPAALNLWPGEALAFTSLSGVERAAALLAERGMPVFAVGDATAAAARAAGFTDVTSAKGDVEALSTLIGRSKPRGVLHPGAKALAGDLVGALKARGIRARAVAVYETRAAKASPPSVSAALSGRRLAAALFHSPKASRAAAALFERQPGLLAAVSAIGLSPACAAPLRGLGFKAVLAADAPTDTALLGVLARTIWAPPHG